MAVAPTGAIYKALEFDGVSSRTYGVYITGEAVYNAPERDVEMITIPGRSGAFALDNGRFENIEVSYPAGIFAETEADFREAISDFRNFLCSRKGYVRLQDEYNPDEYRMAVYKSGLEVDPAMLKAGEFQITFDCKPQRWLVSGEELVEVGEYAEPVGTDNVPYLFRSSPQFSDGYDTEMDKLVGGTVAWNQLQRDVTGATKTVGGLTIDIDADGYITIVGTATESVENLSFSPQITTVPANHVLLYQIDGSIDFVWGRGGFAINSTGNYLLHKYSLAFSAVIYIKIVSGQTYNSRFRFNIIDLTKMFGTTIADYIYSLEQATAGAGVAFFKTLFPKPYYAYNEGELMSVKGLVSHDMVGFNAWDEEWEAYGSSQIKSKNLIPLIAGATYYLKVPAGVGGTIYFKEDADIPSSSSWSGANETFTVPSNCHYGILYAGSGYGTTYKNDICINLSWDGSEDGNYEPYQKWSYPLDSDLELRGIPKIENGNLYYDGDTYEADGTVTRKYGIVDLGTLDWIYISVQTRFYATVSNAKFPSGDYSIKANIVCVKYPTVNFNEIQDGQHDKVIAAVTTAFNEVSIRDTAYTDGATLKTALNGVYLVYELATPTTETADPYQHIQVCDPYGTEEYVSTSIVPVGHNTKYGQDPNVLDNPTLFESSPLLEVEGYGSIGVNGYVIEISSAEAQTIPIAESEQYSYVNSVSFNFDETAFNTGDTIQINGGALTGLAGINGNQVYISSASDSDNRFSTTYNGYSASTTNFETITFNVGTYTEIVDTTTFLCLTDGSKTLKRDIKIKYTTGNITITVSTRPDSDAGMLWGTIRINQYGINGYSSKTSSMFIDCDLGEAYKVVDGETISLNSYIDLGSDLPTLAPGTNTVTYDNTITDLKIQPRWWKV